MKTTSKQTRLRLGIDIGGTFTDFVVYDEATGQITTFKISSTPVNPAIAVLEGLSRVRNMLSDGGQRDGLFDITHGSTVATNALLEKKGAKTALVTTDGFKDLIEIGRQNRQELYSLSPQKHEQIIPKAHRLTVKERVLHDGSIQIPLSEDEIDKVVRKIKGLDVESVAIVLLFSFANPSHEKMIANALEHLGLHVSRSSEIMPEFREYERTSTTVVNAYVSPVMARYIELLEEKLPRNKNRIRIMQSNGGSISLGVAKREGVRCILSGPAGGVIASKFVAEQLREDKTSLHSGSSIQQPLNIITFDMGGTSTDVSLIESEPRITTEAYIRGYPIHLPMIDIHTIGAGGGSVAYIDDGGSLRVGPQSAGADPGPACYGKSMLPTVTDANVVLGRIIPDYFLGGEIEIDSEKSYQALSRLSERLSLSVEALAEGMIEIVNSHMSRALRVISVEQGYDPKTFALLSFGGAGGLHAVDLAHILQIPRVIIPPLASTFSAYGMLVANVIKDYAKTIMVFGDASIDYLNESFNPLVEKGIQDLLNEGFTNEQILIEKSLDARYAGQSYEINIPFSRNWKSAFENAHQKKFGFIQEGTTVQVVNIRVRAIGLVDGPKMKKMVINDHQPDENNGIIEHRKIIIDHQDYNIPVYRGEVLIPNQQIRGPAIIVRSDTTILLKHNDLALVDVFSNLIINTGFE